MHIVELMICIPLSTLLGRQNREGCDDCGMYTAWERRQSHTEFWLENL